MHRLRCKVCGNLFLARSIKARYCSDSCRNNVQIKKRTEWNTNHPNYMKMYMRKYREQRNELKKMDNDNHMQKCPTCGMYKERNTDNFAKHAGRKFGFSYQCKECRKVIDRQRYEEKREVILAQKKVYYQKKKKEGSECIGTTRH